MSDTPAPIGHNNPPEEGPPLTEMLSDWFTLKGTITELTAKENNLRKAIFAKAFPNAKEKGTQRTDIGFGKELKVVAKVNYTIDREGLSAAIKRGVSSDVLDLVVKYKPEVVESELLRVTDPKMKAELASFITSKPGMPSMEIVDAKK